MNINKVSFDWSNSTLYQLYKSVNMNITTSNTPTNYENIMQFKNLLWKLWRMHQNVARTTPPAQQLPPNLQQTNRIIRSKMQPADGN